MPTAEAAAPDGAPPPPPKAAVSAVEMGARQREISVSEFFAKNRHLLGFDNPRKALLTTVKEAVDNSLDACEEAGILPDVVVKVEVVPSNGSPTPPASQATRFRVTVSDNGPGIVRQQIPPIFAKLLYGSKFHRLRMSRGQQGIGISAAGMYGQLTTGKPVQIISRTGARTPAHYFEIQIDTKKNEPRIFESKKIDWEQPARHPGDARDRGPLPEGPRLGGRVPRADRHRQPARQARLPHAGGRDAGVPADDPRAAARSRARSSRIPTASSSACCCGCSRTRRATRSRASSPATSAASRRALAEEICKTAKLSPDARPRNVHGEDAEALYKAIQATKIMAPPSNCISPIGEKAILHGLYKQIKGEFYTAVTRPPAVYRGNPFVIEAGLAFGKGPDQAAADRRKRRRPRSPRARSGRTTSELARVIRYANRVPLLYQQSACATFKAALETAWRNYGVAQSRGALPGRPHGDLRPHGLGLGAVHQRVQGSDRRLRRDPQGDQARAAGVRAPARRVPAAARAGQERVPPAQHLRALHRGGRRGLRPAEGRQAAQGEAQGASSRRSP